MHEIVPFRDIEDVIIEKKARGRYNCNSSRFKVDQWRTYTRLQQNLPVLAMKQSTFITKSVSTMVVKSKSDSELCTLMFRKHAHHGNPELSPYPSDSDITIVRLQKNSKAGYRSTEACEGILGDGFHLTESSSMVNLVTLVPCSETPLAKEDHLVSLSSWDIMDSLFVTSSDSIIDTSNINRNKPRLSLISFATVSKHSKNVQTGVQKVKITPDKNETLIGTCADTKKSNNTRILFNRKSNDTSRPQVLLLATEEVEEIIADNCCSSKNQKYLAKFKKPKRTRFTTLIRKAFCRAVHSCICQKRNKDSAEEGKN